MTDSNLHPVFKNILDSQLSIHSVTNRYLFYYEDEGEKGYTFEIEAKHPDDAFDKAYASYGPQVEDMMYKQL